MERSTIYVSFRRYLNIAHGSEKLDFLFAAMAFKLRLGGYTGTAEISMLWTQ
jgi:hypothetical protein